MKLRLSPRAAGDLDGIASYLYARDPRAAQHVQDQLTAALRLLTTHPQVGRPMGRELRRFAVPRLPYLIVYRLDEAADAIAVATIRHTSRQPLA